MVMVMTRVSVVGYNDCVWSAFKFKFKFKFKFTFQK